MKNEGQGRAWRFLPSIRLVGIDPFVFAENHAGVGKKWVYLNQLFSGLSAGDQANDRLFNPSVMLIVIKNSAFSFFGEVYV